MKRIRLGIVLAGIAVFFLSASLLWAESQARIVRLSLVDGSVELDRATGQGFQPAIQNMPITQGMRLRIGSGSNAEVEFENGSTLRLIGNTSVSFGRLSLSDDGGKLTALNVEEGTAYFDIKKQSRDEFAISFAGREIRVLDPSHLRVDVSDSRAEVAMFKGEAELAEDNSVRIKKDQTLAFDRNGDEQGPYDVAKGVTDEPSDAWDKEREKYIDSYAQQSSVVNSPYNYGLSDLSYYGGYYMDPSYGYLWRPYGVTYDWQPFGNGAWVWYPGFGYTWVSTYPWGWVPYRYGSWVFVPAYGWCWRPGYWNNWWRGPVVVNAPPHWSPPRPPRHHDDPVVWVGNPGGNHDRDRWEGRVTTKVHDRDTGNRHTMTMAPTQQSAPATSPQPNVPASSLTGNGGTLVTTVPADGEALRRGDNDRHDGMPRVPHGRVTQTLAPGSQTSPAVVVGGGSSAPSQPRVDSRRGTPSNVQPHVDVPRSAPRMDTPRSAPSMPRSAPPSAPRMEAPHMSAPSSMSHGSSASAGRSPK